MSDFDWIAMEREEALEAIRKLRRLPISCDRYYYFGGGQPHPLIKFDSRKKEFFCNEYFKKIS